LKVMSSNNYYQRYTAGEHVAVWQELMLLGENVRNEPFYSDALTVAAETMRRARRNVEVLVRRLRAMGYRFQGSFWPSMEILSGLRTMEVPGELRKAASACGAVHCRDGRQRTANWLKSLEELAGGPLPLSLQAWYEQVGAVSLLGSHPAINPRDSPELLVDPLVIFPLGELCEEMETAEQEAGELLLPLSPDDYHKANMSGGPPYSLKIPDAGADARFSDWHQTSFVNYLRIAFQWGGFPGWERSANPPIKEIGELTHGLLPL
jgi:hypothetical protein